MRLQALFNSLTFRNRPAPEDDFWFTSVSRQGSYIDPESVIGVAAVYACVQAVAQSMSTLPLITYKRGKDGTRQRANKHPLYDLLRLRPNQNQTKSEFIEMLVAYLMLRGNFYAQIYRERNGDIAELIPLKPTSMSVEVLASGDLNYRYTRANGEVRNFPAKAIFHVRGWYNNGVIGFSPVTLAQETFRLAQITEGYARKFFTNNANPGGILKHPKKLNVETSDRIKRSWTAAHAGMENAFKVALLEEGMEWIRVGLSAQDAQFIEQRQFDVEQTCRLFRIPPHIVQDLRRATFSNIEHQDLQFVKHTLTPYAVRMEERIQVSLIGEDEDEIFAEFMFDALLRGDYKSRQEGLEIQRRNGIISANDWCRIENMNPIEDDSGDIRLVPLNMADMKMLNEIQDPANKQPAALPSPADDKKDDEPTPKLKIVPKKRDFQSLKSANRTLFSEIFRRAVKKEMNFREKYEKNDGFSVKFDEFKTLQKDFLGLILSDAVRCYDVTLSVLAGSDPQVRDPKAIIDNFWLNYRDIMATETSENDRVERMATGLLGYLETLNPEVGEMKYG